MFALGKASTTAGRIVSAIGEKAGVVVDKAKDQYATAHDLRRSFATRWAPKVKPATLQRLMRHTSIVTTLKFYAALDADDIAAELWKAEAGTGSKAGGTGCQEDPASAAERSGDGDIGASREVRREDEFIALPAPRHAQS